MGESITAVSIVCHPGVALTKVKRQVSVRSTTSSGGCGHMVPRIFNLNLDSTEKIKGGNKGE